MVHRSPSITTFHKAQSTKFYFNRAFWDNVISILQQHTRNDVSMLSPGSADYTTSFKPVISSDWILMPFCTGWHDLMRKSPFHDFNSTHWHFLIYWALTVPPGAHSWAEFRWQIGQSATPAHSFLTHGSTCRLDMYKPLQMPPLCEKDLSWKKQYMGLHCKEFPFCLPVMAKYLTS